MTLVLPRSGQRETGIVPASNGKLKQVADVRLCITRDAHALPHNPCVPTINDTLPYLDLSILYGINQAQQDIMLDPSQGTTEDVVREEEMMTAADESTVHVRFS